MTHFNTYHAATEWLFSQSRGHQPRDPARMRYLLKQLKTSQPKKNIHVVGTNGKGTVCNMLASSFQAAGFKSGLSISPHIEDFRERISVGGAMISEQEVIDFCNRIAQMNLEPQPAFFELNFALALEHFAKHDVDIAIIEAGVGAKNDATIVLENVAAVVITSVARDHEATLGYGVKAIAQDKAEAIRPNIPVVTGVDSEALEVIQHVAQERHSPLIHMKTKASLLPDCLHEMQNAEPTRWHNAQLAATTFNLLGNHDDDALCTGLQARLPARTEKFIIEGREVILDGAHNPEATQALRRTMRQAYILIFAAKESKLFEESLAELEPDAKLTIITTMDEQPSPVEIKATRVFINDAMDALRHALNICPADTSIVITGSFYLAGKLRPWLRGNDRPV